MRVEGGGSRTPVISGSDEESGPDPLPIVTCGDDSCGNTDGTMVTGEEIVVGHRSSSTALNVYTHVTKAMERQAAARIDRGIGRQEAPPEEVQEAKQPTVTAFRADPGKRRKPGTGCVHQIGDYLWEGRYSPRGPDGKQRFRNVYDRAPKKRARRS